MYLQGHGIAPFFVVVFGLDSWNGSSAMLDAVNSGSLGDFGETANRGLG